MPNPEIWRFCKRAGRNLLLMGLLSCQDEKIITQAAVTAVVTAEPATKCVLPRENLSIDWQPWEENLPLTFFLPDRSDIIFTRKSVQAKNRDGILKPGIWMTIKQIGPPDWKPEIIQQGFLRPFSAGFFDIRGKLITLYACDEEGKEIYWADKIGNAPETP